jgi:hypothetical protein
MATMSIRTKAGAPGCEIRQGLISRLLLCAVIGFSSPRLEAQVVKGGTPAAMITHTTCVDSTRRWLGALAGEYRVQTVTRAGPSAWDTSMANARFGWELGGCLMVEHFAGRRGGEAYETVALWGTSGSLDHPIQRVFAHSQHGLLGLSEGSWNAAGDTLTMSDSALVRGTWIQERYVVSRPPGGVLTAEGLRSEDVGRTWTVTLRARYMRTAPH